MPTSSFAAWINISSRRGRTRPREQRPERLGGRPRHRNARATRSVRSLSLSANPAWANLATLLSARDSSSRDEAAGPRPLEVVAADATIHVEDFADEKQPGPLARGHRCGVDLVQRHAT